MTTHYDPYPQNVAFPQRAAFRQRAAAPAQSASPVAGTYAPPLGSQAFGPAAEETHSPDGNGLRIDGLAVAALIIAAFFIFQSIRDGAGPGEKEAAPVSASSEPITADAETNGPGVTEAQEEEVAPPPPPEVAADPWAITYPYDEYWLTQGPHGYSYGHMAIDLAAGKGEPIKSPIHGVVTANYVDEYGNTTLIIENDVYLVTLLHGNYSAQTGQQVAQGELVGSEWNNGYTLDMNGRSCRNRDCGYHTHMNVYSKQIHANVNPLDVLQ